jgi:capsule polysaccharide export protein KpsE/RkpR
MESPDFLLKIIHDLGLDKAWAKRVFKSTQDQPSDQEALAYMRKIVKLDFARGTNIIDITVSSDVPEEAADIANAIADLYKVRRDAEQARRESEGEDAFRDQVAQQQKVVDDARTALEKMPKDQSPTLHDTQVKFERQQVLLDALNVRLQQFEANSHLLQSPVRTISRAGPARADRSFASLITTVAAGCLGVMAASFVEIILLFSRAGGRPNN